jgi:hypothetical protein
MARYHGGDQVKAGFYFNMTKWEVQTLSGKGGRLVGAAGQRYMRVPAIGVLALAPFMGAAYAIFLPFIGIALVLQYLAKRGYALAGDMAHATQAAMGHAWRPGEAYFAGPEDKEKKRGETGKDVEERLKALDEEIAKHERDDEPRA